MLLTQHTVNYFVKGKNSLYLGEKVEHSLLCPNQCREKGIEIYTCPKAYCNEESAQNLTISEANISIPL